MADTVVLTPEQVEEKKKEILALNSKKHVKIWLLHDVCLLKSKDIQELVGSNAGAVGNAIKGYLLEPQKIEAAKALLK